jgi:hypothetical protein
MNARTIVKSLHGMWVEEKSYGLARCPCHDDRKPSLKIKDDARKIDGIDLVCFAGCDWKDVKSELQRQGLIDLGRKASKNEAKSLTPTVNEVRKNPAQNAEKFRSRSAENHDAARGEHVAHGLWQQSIPLPDTLGWKYFTERRGLHIGVLGPLDHALRFHPGKRAVIGLMTDPVTNKPTGVHRTFLNADATKRERKMLGHRGVIRLSADENVTTGLGICEGVEDGLAILISGWAPIWAATCAEEIKKFPVLPGFEALTIFADCDVVGTAAAQSCAKRWRDSGCDVAIEGISQ